METCTYDLGHSAARATHYYNAYEGDRVNLCTDCAAGFGYPQYLVEYPVEAPWRPVREYLVTVLDGNGLGGELPELFTMDDNGAEWWLGLMGCPEVDYLLGDALWEPYRAHQAVNGNTTYEVRAVTVLPLARV